MRLKSQRLFIGSLFLVVAWATPALAKCTFNNVSATRDSSGKNITVSPTLTQCDTIPSQITLDVFNFSSLLNTAQVFYLSGPGNISSSGSTVKPGGMVASASIHSSSTLSFSAAGDYTFQARGRFGPSTPSPTFVIRISEFRVTPDHINMATGGVAPNANVFSVNTGLSGQIKFSTFFVNNEGGVSRSNVSINNQSNAKQGIVSVSPQGSSGVFRVETTNSIFSANLAYVVVPPQPLIQVLIGEAQGESTNAQRSVGAVVRNRIGHPLFRNQNTYSSVIFAPSQFRSTETNRFVQAASRAASNPASYDTALNIAAGIFARTDNLNLAGAISFGSPKAVLSSAQLSVEMAKLNDVINKCPKVSAKTLKFDSRWYPSLGIEEQQAIVFNEIDPKVFVFIRQRPSKDSCAIIRISLQ